MQLLAAVDPTPILVALVGGGGVGVVLKYMLDKRNSSGTTKTADAATLFSTQLGASDDQRELLAQFGLSLSQGLTELNEVRTKLADVFKENLELQGQNALKSEELVRVHREVTDRDKIIERGQAENDRLQSEVESLRTSVATLTGAAKPKPIPRAVKPTPRKRTGK